VFLTKIDKFRYTGCFLLYRENFVNIQGVQQNRENGKYTGWTSKQRWFVMYIGRHSQQRAYK